MLLVNVELYGGHDVETLVTTYCAGLDPESTDAVLAGLTGSFVDAARQPPPGLPILRAAQGASTLGWLRRHLA